MVPSEPGDGSFHGTWILSATSDPNSQAMVGRQVCAIVHKRDGRAKIEIPQNPAASDHWTTTVHVKHVTNEKLEFEMVMRPVNPQVTPFNLKIEYALVIDPADRDVVLATVKSWADMLPGAGAANTGWQSDRQKWRRHKVSAEK